MARVRVDDKEVGSLGIGTHLHVDRPAGQYRLAIDHPLDFGKAELTVTVAAENDYYFKIVPGGSQVALVGNGAAVSNRLAVTEIGKPEANALMQDMKK